MKSISVYTEELDDIKKAAEELYDKAKSFKVNENTLGLLYCDSETDWNELVKELAGYFNFPLKGITTIASVCNGHLVHAGITLNIFTSETNVFKTVLTSQLNKTNNKESIRTAIRMLEKMFGEAPDFCIVIAPPINNVVMPQIYIETINEEFPTMPITGAIATYHPLFSEGYVMDESGQHSDRAILIGVKGDIRPIFIRNLTLGTHFGTRLPVKAKDNIIYKVNGKTFLKYMEDLGLSPDNLVNKNKNIVADFIANPIVVFNNSEPPYVVGLSHINAEDESAVMTGEIQNGSFITIATLTKMNIQQSASECIKETAKLLSEKKYGTVMGVSCLSRYLVSTNNKELESDMLMKILPENVNCSLFYSYGEFYPQQSENGVLNTYSNLSFMLYIF